MSRKPVCVAAAIAAVLATAVIVPGLSPRSSAGELASDRIDAAWRVVWADDFDGPAGSSPNAALWTYDLGRSWSDGPPGWGHNELQDYTSSPANVSLNGRGQLALTPTFSGGQWYSARLKTNRVDFRPARGGSLAIQTRVALPAGGQGYFPAFWAISQAVESGAMPWPTGGEIDIMENINGERIVQGVLHCGTDRGGPCEEPEGRDGEVDLGGAILAPHTYTVIWDDDPARLTFQLDGRTINTVTPADVGQETWDAALDHGYRLMLNIAIGGDWPGAPDATTRPGAPMIVDYVKVWSSP